VSAPRGLRVAVTRPAVQANEWVARLQAAGIDAFALPLIEIVPAGDPEALVDAWASLASRTLVMFVSHSSRSCRLAIRKRSSMRGQVSRAARW